MPIGTNANHIYTDELAIVAALARLPTFDVLNMSFGTEGRSTGTGLDSQFACALGGGGSASLPLMTPALLEASLCLLLGSDSTTMSAAGGTEDQTSPIYPAAFEGVVGVGATNGGDSASDPLVTWNHGMATAPGDESDLWWIERRDLGCNLVGIGTENRSDVVVWSGSSFATAVVSAKEGPGRSIPPSVTSQPVAMPVDQC